MDGVTFAWTLVATLFAGIQLFFSRVVAKEERDSAFNGLMMYTWSGIFALAGVYYFSGIPENWHAVAFFGIASGATHGLGNFIRIEGLKYIDSVIFFPINKVLGPLLVVAGGVFLFGDALTFVQYVGVALSVTVPLLLVSAVEHHRQNNLRSGLIHVVVATLFTAISILLTKKALGGALDVFFFILMAQVGGTVISASILAWQNGVRRRALAHLGLRDVTLGLIAGLLGFLSYATLSVAISRGLVSLIYVIHAHYILIPIVLSVWWYKDHINMRKLAAVIVSCLAITLLYNI